MFLIALINSLKSLRSIWVLCKHALCCIFHDVIMYMLVRFSCVYLFIYIYIHDKYMLRTKRKWIYKWIQSTQGFLAFDSSIKIPFTVSIRPTIVTPPKFSSKSFRKSYHLQKQKANVLQKMSSKHHFFRGEVLNSRVERQ